MKTNDGDERWGRSLLTSRSTRCFANVQICKCANVQISCAAHAPSMEATFETSRSTRLAPSMEATFETSRSTRLAPSMGATFKTSRSTRLAPSMEATFETSRSTRLAPSMGATFETSRSTRHKEYTPCLAFFTPCLGIFTPCLGIFTRKRGYMWRKRMGAKSPDFALYTTNQIFNRVERDVSNVASIEDGAAQARSGDLAPSFAHTSGSRRSTFAHLHIAQRSAPYSLITFTSPPAPSLMMLEAGGLLRSSRREVHT